MTDSPSDLDPAGGAGGYDPEPAVGMPRWVKVALIIALALVLLFVVAKVAGIGGEHGPGRHGGSDSTPGHKPPAGHGP